MRKSLFAMALGTFALGCSEFGMMSILSEVADSFNISAATAGHFISSYALGVCAGAVLFVIIARRWPLQKQLFVLAGVICAGNLLAVIAPDYRFLILARFVSGLPHGAFFGVGGIIVQKITPPRYQAEAVATMFSGMTIANLAGIPAAVYITHLVSWHILFLLVSSFALITMFLIYKWVPDVGAMADNGLKKQFDFLKRPAPWLLLGTIALGNGGLFGWYSYINPIMVNSAGFPQVDMSWIMAVSGVGMVLGNYAAGKLSLRYSMVSIIIGMLGLMTAAAVMIVFAAFNPYAALLAMFIGVFGLFGVSSMEQTQIIDASKGSELLGASSAQVAFNLGNALGAFFGGLPLRMGYAYQYSGIPGILLNAIGLALIMGFAHIHAGRRQKGAVQ